MSAMDGWDLYRIGKSLLVNVIPYILPLPYSTSKGQSQLLLIPRMFPTVLAVRYSSGHHIPTQVVVLSTSNGSRAVTMEQHGRIWPMLNLMVEPMASAPAPMAIHLLLPMWRAWIAVSTESDILQVNVIQYSQMVPSWM